MTQELKTTGGRICEHLAIEYAKNWRQATKDIKVLKGLKAFFIPKNDIDPLYWDIHNRAGVGIRGYLGIDEHGNMKFLMVPVIEDPQGGFRDKLHNFSNPDAETEESDIYDFTRPCPSLCDDESPLNGIGEEAECTSNCQVRYDEQHA